MSREQSNKNEEMILNRMGMDLTVNEENISHRMRLDIKNGFTYDISIMQIHKQHTKKDIDAFGVDAWVVHIECYYDRTGERKGFYKYTNFSDLLPLLNEKLGYNFKSIKFKG